MKIRVKPNGHRRRLVPHSCPDCAGVLQMEEQGPRRYVLYCCQIGHRYSASSLLHSKERQLERYLWSATVLLNQLGDVYEQFLHNMPRRGSHRKAVQQRIQAVKKQSLAIRKIIEATHVT